MARDFDDATSQILTSAGTPDVLNGATSCSVAAWVWADDNTTAHRIVTEWGNADANRTFSLAINTSGQTEFGIESAGNNIAAWRSNTGLSTGAWHHILVTWSQPSTIVVYHDGASVATTVLTDTTVVALRNAATALRIGGDLDGNFMDGKIAEVAIWKNTILNAERAAALGKAFSPLFLPNGQTFYAPCVGRNSPETDVRGGLPLTVTGATNFDHPRIIYPTRPQFMTFATPAAPAGTRQSLMMMGVG